MPGYGIEMDVVLQADFMVVISSFEMEKMDDLGI